MSTPRVMVVGGGFSGLTAALETAEMGHEVIIVEKNPYLGGRVAQLNQYFPKLCPPSCGLEIQFQRIRNNPLVKVLTLSEVKKIEGGPGNYKITVATKPRFVNERCTACGECAKACEVETDCEFDFGLGKRKAVYRPYIQAFPMRYVLDKHLLNDEQLKKVVGACKYNAFDLDEKPVEKVYEVASLVWTTGWKPYSLSKLDNLGGGLLKNVVHNMHIERMSAPNGPTMGSIVRPSDKRVPRKVAFVQCAGSRDENHLGYCSYICCMASLKQATYIRERMPDAEVTIFYIDLRTPGRYHNFMKKVTADPKLKLVKGKVAKIVESAATFDPTVTVEDAVTGIKTEERFDLVVLATGMQPTLSGEVAPGGLTMDEEGFLVPDSGAGAIPAGCAKIPLDVMRSAQTATAASLTALQTLARR